MNKFKISLLLGFMCMLLTIGICIQVKTVNDSSTGVGKTKLLEMLALLYGKGELKWHRLQIHAGTTDKKIVDFIEEITEKEKNGKKDDILTILIKLSATKM